MTGGIALLLEYYPGDIDKRIITGVKTIDAIECRAVTEPAFKPCTAFNGQQLLSAGPLSEVALAVKRASQAGASGPLLVFDDATGHVVDLDLRG